MADKFRTRINGIKVIKEATVVSSGAPNDGDIVALGVDGKLDPSVLPAGTVSPWEKYSVTLNNGVVTVADSILNTAFMSVKYIINIQDETNNAFKYFEMAITNINGTYDRRIYAKNSSGSVNITVDTINNLGTMELRVGNSESYDLQMDFARIII